MNTSNKWIIPENEIILAGQGIKEFKFYSIAPFWIDFVKQRSNRIDKSEGLILYFRFDESEGSVIYDKV